MKPIIQLLCALCVLCGSISTVHAQSLRFFGRAAEVFEGDAVVLTGSGVLAWQGRPAHQPQTLSLPRVPTAAGRAPLPL